MNARTKANGNHERSPNTEASVEISVESGTSMTLPKTSEADPGATSMTLPKSQDAAVRVIGLLRQV
jgi:hypothetical protein